MTTVHLTATVTATAPAPEPPPPPPPGTFGTGTFGAGTFGIGGTGMQALNVVPLGRSRTPTLLVRVTAPSGAWVYLDQVGRVSGLSYSWTYPGGPSSADWSLDVTPGAHIAALTQGSLVAIYRGTSLVWSGRVSGIDRGSPWRITADGKGSLAVHEPVSVTGSLDAIVDQAITNGLAWTRPASLATTTWSGGAGGQDLATTMLDQVLTDVLVQSGKRWTVTPAGVVSAVSDPTAVALLLRADTVPPLVLGQYASEVTVTYQTSTGTYSTVRVTNSAAAARFGRVAATLNMGYSVLTSSQATAAGQAYLDRRAPAMTLAGDLTLTRGQAVTTSGGPVDLPLVRPGVIGRISVLPLLRDALLVPTANVDVLIGATTYNADQGTLAVSPVNRAPSPGEVILGAAA